MKGGEERRTTVLHTEERNQHGVDDDDDCSPEVDLHPLLARRRLVWHNQGEHDEGERKQAVCSPSVSKRLLSIEILKQTHK